MAELTTAAKVGIGVGVAVGVGVLIVLVLWGANVFESGDSTDIVVPTPTPSSVDETFRCANSGEYELTNSVSAGGSFALFGNPMTITNEADVAATIQRPSSGTGQAVIFSRSGTTWSSLDTTDFSAPSNMIIGACQISPSGEHVCSAIQNEFGGTNSESIRFTRKDGSTYFNSSQSFDATDLSLDYVLTIAFNKDATLQDCLVSYRDVNVNTAVRHYKFGDGTWTLNQTITTTFTDDGTWFGTSISLNGNNLILGQAVPNRLWTYVREDADGQWSLDSGKTVIPDGGSNQWGLVLSESAERLNCFVGDPLCRLNNLANVGRVFVMHRDSTALAYRQVQVVAPASIITNQFYSIRVLAFQNNVFVTNQGGTLRTDVYTYDPATGQMTFVRSLDYPEGVTSVALAADFAGYVDETVGRVLIGSSTNSGTGVLRLYSANCL